MRNLLSAFVFFKCVTVYAGTGHTNDMGIMYGLILSVLGLILLFWNGFDYLSDNKKQIRDKVRREVQKLRRFLERAKFIKTA